MPFLGRGADIWVLFQCVSNNLGLRGCRSLTRCTHITVEKAKILLNQ